MLANLLSIIGSGASHATRRLRNATPENPQYSLGDPELWDILRGGDPSEAGINVNPKVAIGLSPFWLAVGTISGDIAAMPRDVYRRTDNDDREVYLEHPAQFLISDEPNEETPAFEFWQRLMAHALVWGNGYAWIDRGGEPGSSGNRNGPPRGLYNLLPDRTAPDRTAAGERMYVTEVDGQLRALFKEEVLHIKGLSIDNGKGYDVVCAARNAIGLALAAEGYASKFFANGAQGAGVVQIPSAFSEKAAQNLEEGFRKRTGPDNWFRVLVLRDGAKFDITTLSAEQSQLHELREDQRRSIGDYFQLPPFKMNLPDANAYRSAEAAQLVYLTGCLTRWKSSIEGESKMKLLTRPERRAGRVYIEHNVTKWLEIDVKTMNEVLHIQRQDKIINANEWRRKIGLNQRTDPDGNKYENPNTGSDKNTKSASGGEQGAPANTGEDPGTQNRGALLSAPLSLDGRGAGGEGAGSAIDSAHQAHHRLILGIGRNARHRAGRGGKSFCAFVDGRLASHRAEAKTLGLDEALVDPIQDALANVALTATADNLAAEVDRVMSQFEADC